MIRFFIVPIMCLLLTNCSPPPPPVEAINSIMKDIENAIENKKTSRIMNYIHDGFRGNEHVDKTQLRKLIAVHFLRHNNVSVYITHIDVKHDPAQPFYATMQGTIALTGSDNILPKDGRLYSISGLWEQHGDDWLLSELTWQ